MPVGLPGDWLSRAPFSGAAAIAALLVWDTKLGHTFPRGKLVGLTLRAVVLCEMRGFLS